MGKNVAVFVDVANVFYAAKAAGVDIDYVTLLKSVTAGRDLVRAYAYTGLDPDNENQRNFHDFLRRSGYKVVSKDIRKYGDGKVKANLDIELVVDMMKTARNLDIAIVVSGDGDFAPAIRAVQEQGVRVEVLSFRGNTSSDLMDVADLFTDIAQIAKVEKGSSRSGRRVASDDEDLSMTEVPDKQSEGTGRGRPRGRGRVRPGEVEPVAAAPAAAPRGRGRARTSVADESAHVALPSGGMSLVALPGEKLSKAKAAPVAAVPTAAADDAADDADEPEELGAVEPTIEGGAEEAPRRRRRRGGRGRGRGRGREDGVAGADGTSDGHEDEDMDAEDMSVALPATPAAPAKRAAHAFGSVWDSQIGMPTSAAGAGAPMSAGSAVDDEDLDEPPIPEYLIAERRQRDGRGGGMSGRGGGGRSGYSAAVDRERYGGGRSGPTGASGAPGRPSRYAEPAPRSGGGGGGGGGREPDRFRGDRPAPRPAPRPVGRTGSPDEPWSEVPPEIEAMLRAQLGGRAAMRPPVTRPEAAASTAEASDAPKAAPKRRTTRKPAATPAEAPAAAVAPDSAIEAPSPKPRAARKPVVKAKAPASEASVAEAAPKRRTTRKAAVASEAAAPTEAKPAPKRRATRKAAEPAG